MNLTMDRAKELYDLREGLFHELDRISALYDSSDVLELPHDKEQRQCRLNSLVERIEERLGDDYLYRQRRLKRINIIQRQTQ